MKKPESVGSAFIWIFILLDWCFLKFSDWQYAYSLFTMSAQVEYFALDYATYDFRIPALLLVTTILAVLSSLQIRVRIHWLELVGMVLYLLYIIYVHSTWIEQQFKLRFPNAQ